MKFSSELKCTRKLAVRKNEDKRKPEHKALKDKSLDQAAVCLNCEKDKCIGSANCYREEERKRGS